MFNITPYLKPVFDGRSIIFSSKNTHVSTPKQIKNQFLILEIISTVFRITECIPACLPKSCPRASTVEWYRGNMWYHNTP